MAFPDELVALDHAAPDREHQRDCEICGCGIEHTWSVRHRDAASAARLGVDVVVADAVVGDESQRRQPVEHRVVDDVARDDQRFHVVAPAVDGSELDRAELLPRLSGQAPRRKHLHRSEYSSFTHGATLFS